MTSKPEIRCSAEADLQAAAFRDLLVSSGLGRTRPVKDIDRLDAMLRGATLVLTARSSSVDSTLLGVARCLTDFRWCCYVAELAVAKSAQGLGVGRMLMDELRRNLGPEVSVVLLSLPESANFYERIGLDRTENAFMDMRQQ